MKFSPVFPNTWGIDSCKPTGEILAVKIFEVVLELENTSQVGENTPIITPHPNTIHGMLRKLRSNSEDTESKVLQAKIHLDSSTH